MEHVDDNQGHVLVVKDPPQVVVDELKATYQHFTYPFIFIGNDEFIGGYTDLVAKTVFIIKRLRDRFGYEADF